MDGLLNENPPAELIREIITTGLSGALRLTREPAKVMIYFDKGKLVFAASNLRSHRLVEILKRNGILDKEPAPPSSDQDLIDGLTRNGQLTDESLAAARTAQIAEVLRLALLWTDGRWVFDSRVRITNDMRAEVDIRQLLLECARHLPIDFVKSRFEKTNGTYQTVSNGEGAQLSPTEARVLSRSATPTSLTELTTRAGLNEQNALRSVYALALSGLLERSDWPLQFRARGAVTNNKARRPAPPVTETAAKKGGDEADARALFIRLRNAKDFYDILDVGRGAESEEIKNSYHALALRFHPDRFHQDSPELRSQVESAFARIAQAYETLGDPRLRAEYDRPKTRPGTTRGTQSTSSPSGSRPVMPTGETSKAETSFQRGMKALQNQMSDEALRSFAEAAMLEPRQARYRAYYGQALSKQPNTRRIAETELLAALALESKNVEYRVMLARLYSDLGLRRRAEGELAKALAIDPKHEGARTLMAGLKNK
jgi:curved DNA-binding protein CbpA